MNGAEKLENHEAKPAETIVTIPSQEDDGSFITELQTHITEADREQFRQDLDRVDRAERQAAIDGQFIVIRAA